LIKQDILMVGVGGQGTILSSDILSEAALKAGYDVKKTDKLGMAQRGGSVTSHIRIGNKIYSPLISPDEADTVIAFEKLEACRGIDFIRKDGTVVINNLSSNPLSVTMGKHQYPTDEEIIQLYKQRTSNIRIIEGTETVKTLGESRALNIFMIGYLSALLTFIDKEIWLECIQKFVPYKILDINAQAFNIGREVAISGHI
jgi:indolepyruvate ferredoxin oxidoreductase, beta subunit